MSTFRSTTVLLAMLALISVTALSGCFSALPEEEASTLTIKGSDQEEAVELTPAEKAAQIAAEFYRVREIEKAIENYENAISLDPEYVDAYLGLGWIYLRETEEYDKALEMFLPARDIAPDDPYARTSLAYAYSVVQDYQSAVNEYIEAIALAPEDPDTFLNLGYTYEKTGMDLAALNAYRRAYELDPNDPRSAQQLANIYYRAGLYDQAIAAYEKVRSFGRPSSYTLKTLGFLYMKVGKLTDAETLFLTALSNEPEDFGSRANLASVYRQMGQYNRAVEQLEALVAQQPNNTDFLGALADAYNDIGRYDSAIATSQRVLQVSPGNGSAYVTWAKALEKKATMLAEQQRDYDGAIAMFGQAIRQLEQARMDPNWSRHANREIERQNQLIEIAQQAKLRGIWDAGEVD
jgi:tetratricopeptide (TPR) repeat protein